jgi:hypothetical protein
MKPALQSAKEDKEWEKEIPDEEGLKSGQISIKVDVRRGKAVALRIKGVGQKPSNTIASEERAEKPVVTPRKKVIVHAIPPAIATKSVLAQDVYNVSPGLNPK